MAAYYNEFDPFAAEWLRGLIKDGRIADGDVDERSITEVRGADLEGYTQCHFFAGIGGWSYALRLAGWPDDRAVWTGSCPCQPFSAAGKREGNEDERHLWPDFFRLIRECRPEAVFGEQVEAAIRHGWLDGISADLEGEDYSVGAHVLGAHSVGAPHIRQRLYWVAYANKKRAEMSTQTWFAANSNEAVAWPGTKRQGDSWDTNAYWNMPDARRRCERGALQVVDGISEELEQIGGYGNAIVPQLAAEFIKACEESRSDVGAASR